MHNDCYITLFKRFEEFSNGVIPIEDCSIRFILEFFYNIHARVHSLCEWGKIIVLIV